MAPIAITVYDRSSHFRQCLINLENNTEASETDVLVFMDAAIDTFAAKNQDEIIEFCINNQVFKSITILKSKINLGASGNIMRVFEYMTEHYEFFIVMEDDILCAPEFLQFINKGIQKYYFNKDIVSISGFNIPDFKCETDTYLSKYSNVWGVGYWSHKGLLKYILNVHNPSEELKNPELLKNVIKYHPKLPNLLEKINFANKLDDIQSTLFNIKEQTYQVRPKHSLTKNIGFDGSGENCGRDDRFMLHNLKGVASPSMDEILSYDILVDKQFYDFFQKRDSLYNKVKHKLHRSMKNLAIRK